jgi:tetratricopeptide (TPR) repeat protein
MSDDLQIRDTAPAAPTVGASGPLAPSATSEPLVATTTAAATEGESGLLDRLLAMADTYRAGGHLRQAIELYFSVVEGHLHTAQAGRAFGRLMEIAERYEEAGERHEARSIYERLLRNER